MSEIQFCSGCSKPKPQNYCWEGRDLDCAVHLPPRWATDGAPGVMGLWRILRDLHQKVAWATEQLDLISLPDGPKPPPSNRPPTQIDSVLRHEPRCICEQMRTMEGGGPQVFFTCEVHGFISVKRPD